MHYDDAVTITRPTYRNRNDFDDDFFSVFFIFRFIKKLVERRSKWKWTGTWSHRRWWRKQMNYDGCHLGAFRLFNRARRDLIIEFTRRMQVILVELLSSVSHTPEHGWTFSHNFLRIHSRDCDSQDLNGKHVNKNNSSKCRMNWEILV